MEYTLNRRHRQWKKQIQDYINEWYLLAFLLTGDRVTAEQLLNMAVDQVKDKWSYRHFERLWAKPVIKEYIKFSRNNECNDKYLDFSTLLNRIGLLEGNARVAFLLKYYYGFSYKKIARNLHISERKAKIIIYDAFLLWTNNGKLIPIEQVEAAINKDINLAKNFLLDSFRFEKKNQYIETRLKGKRKALFLIFTIVVLFAGGSINQKTLGKTRVSLGPDVYKIYKEGGVFQLGREIQQKGYTDIYAYPEEENNILYVQFSTAESLENKEEVTMFIESYLKERDLDYEIRYEEMNQVIEAEQTDEQTAESKQLEMEQEIYELLTSNTYYYMQNYVSDSSGESREILLSESIPKEEETMIKEEIKNIMKKFDSEWNFSFGKVDAEVVEMEKAMWNIVPALLEAYMFGGDKYKVYDVYPTYEDEQLKFDIYTELAFTTDEDRSKNIETAKELKRSIQFFFQHEDIQKLFNHAPYVIKIYGNNRKEVEFDI
ncbi:sigma-70 region 4 domain-containing protein [Niallia circulans]|uniref:sigma-70 region 4 domain-containing protein n=1 Tax=Niallia circulans TaxID=1397 RepID=UPI0026EE9717|nr:sigma-70 region 4 domain-containing protein [Niallia circulans]